MIGREERGGACGEIPSRVLDRAIDWLVKLRSGTAGVDIHRDCERWRAADPVHEIAWQRLQEAEAQVSSPPEVFSTLALNTLERVAGDRTRRRFGRKAARLSGLALVTVLVSWLAVWVPSWAPAVLADYATSTGERRVVHLEDGTELVLNTASAVDVEFSAERRLIVLRRGEIMIATGHDAGQRPFWVETTQARLEALGTRFVVLQEDRHTRLSVQDGAVAMYPAAGGYPAVARAGQAFVIDDSGMTRVLDGGMNPAAWVDGALVVKQVRLEDFIAELARYSDKRLRCDPAVADLRVSGVFQLDDPSRALEALTRALPVRVERGFLFSTVVTRD